MKPSLFKIRFGVCMWILLSSLGISVLLLEVIPNRQFDGQLQFSFLGLALAFGLLLAIWTNSKTIGICPTLSPDQQRSAAHAYPFRIARLSFLGTMVAGLAVASFQLMRGLSIGDSLAAGVITYLVATLPILLLYLWLRRVLKPVSEGVPGAERVGGARQSIRMRLMFVVQLPAVMCGVGIVLVENWTDHNYVEDIAQYHAELHERVARQAEMALDAEARIRIVIDPNQRRSPKRRPDFDWPSLLLLVGVLGLSYYLCGKVADDVTIDLNDISDGLAAIDEAQQTASIGNGVGLRETAAVLSAFETTVEGFKRQRADIEKAAAQRREAESQKNRFLAHISHELKSPLNSILGFSELLLAELDGPLSLKQKEMTAEVWHSGDGLLRFILALLDLSRLDGASRRQTGQAQRSGLRIRHCSADEILTALKEQCRSDPTGLVRVEVTGHIESDGIELMLDSAQTARTILLLAGALTDCMESGQVEIDVNACEGQVNISVAVGEGVPRAGTQAAISSTWMTLANQDRREPSIEFNSMPVRLLEAVLASQGGEVTVSIQDGWPRLSLLCPSATA